MRLADAGSASGFAFPLGCGASEKIGRKRTPSAVEQQRHQQPLEQSIAMTGFELILPFLRPIESLILDPGVSEVMVNGSQRVFMERQGYLEPVPVTGLTEKSLLIAVKK